MGAKSTSRWTESTKRTPGLFQRHVEDVGSAERLTESPATRRRLVRKRVDGRVEPIFDPAFDRSEILLASDHNPGLDPNRLVAGPVDETRGAKRATLINRLLDLLLCGVCLVFVQDLGAQMPSTKLLLIDVGNDQHLDCARGSVSPQRRLGEGPRTCDRPTGPPGHRLVVLRGHRSLDAVELLWPANQGFFEGLGWPPAGRGFGVRDLPHPGNRVLKYGYRLGDQVPVGTPSAGIPGPNLPVSGWNRGHRELLVPRIGAPDGRGEDDVTGHTIGDVDAVITRPVREVVDLLPDYEGPTVVIAGGDPLPELPLLCLDTDNEVELGAGGSDDRRALNRHGLAAETGAMAEELAVDQLTLKSEDLGRLVSGRDGRVLCGDEHRWFGGSTCPFDRGARPSRDRDRRFRGLVGFEAKLDRGRSRRAEGQAH